MSSHILNLINMKNFIFLVLLTFGFIVPPEIHSQDPISLYPIKIGNKYVYENWDLFVSCTPTSFLHHRVIEITKDTVFQNGKKYFKFEGYPFDGYSYQRVDTVSKNVYYYDLDSLKEKLLDSLLAKTNDRYDGRRNPASHGVRPIVTFEDTALFFGSQRTFKNILADGLVVMTYTLLEGIGIRSIGTCHGGGNEYILKGCVINGIVYGDTTLTVINTISSGIPNGFKLYDNYPNPFNPSTSIKFDIPVRGKVSLKIFNNLGKEIASVLDSEFQPGTYETFWNASEYSSGIYFYRIEAPGFTKSKRMVLIK